MVGVAVLRITALRRYGPNVSGESSRLDERMGEKYVAN